jgi:hypothetical protein
VRLESPLPLNLRYFLMEEFGPTVRIEHNLIYAPFSGVSELFMRELARAIRRFSFTRSRERWIECEVTGSWLDGILERAQQEKSRVCLCLRCAQVVADAESVGQHYGRRCVTFRMSSEPRDEAQRPLSHSLYEMIESFRRARVAEGQSHYDLDYYIQNGSFVFTWRPLPPVTGEL